MYCPQCGVQTGQLINFCKSCGLKLAIHRQLLESSHEAEHQGQQSVKNEKRLMIGLYFMMANTIITLACFSIFGLTVLFHPEGRPALRFMFTLYLAMSFIIGGIGLLSLIRSGYLRKAERLYHEQALIKMHKGLQGGKSLEASTVRVIQAETAPRLAEAVSATEATTLELENKDVDHPSRA